MCMCAQAKQILTVLVLYPVAQCGVDPGYSINKSFPCWEFSLPLPHNIFSCYPVVDDLYLLAFQSGIAPHDLIQSGLADPQSQTQRQNISDIIKLKDNCVQIIQICGENLILTTYEDAVAHVPSLVC